ncbi:MAG: methylthioribulose 1-phosphate dehydratase [Phycisphaera sp.]|nr:methylthioribulose 1-phosphate dehydratase [Phycisphaera sp.]
MSVINSHDITESQRTHRRALAEVGRMCHARGWSLGTSSNYSVVIDRDPLRVLITASGKDKGRLGDDDFVVVDGDGAVVDPLMPRPSAETMLHVVLARMPGVGSVLHTHSVWATVLSDMHAAAGELSIEGYEMLKGLDDVRTHDHRERVRVYDNTQDIAALAERVTRELADGDERLRHGFLMRGHGLYTWGGDLDAARRHVEVLEFLFEVVARRMILDPARYDPLAAAAAALGV